MSKMYDKTYEWPAMAFAGDVFPAMLAATAWHWPNHFSWSIPLAG
jgi:hypothetical protein